jgi:hypothetical protein
VSAPFEVREVTPTGERTSGCFVDYADGTGEFKDMTFKSYPDSPRGRSLFIVRHTAGIYLGTAGKLLGLGAVDISGLERGAFEFVDDADWARAEALITDAGRAALAGQS